MVKGSYIDQRVGVSLFSRILSVANDADVMTYDALDCPIHFVCSLVCNFRWRNVIFCV